MVLFEDLAGWYSRKSAVGTLIVRVNSELASEVVYT